MEMNQGVIEKIKWAIIFWLAHRLPDCKTITPKLGESLDRKLPLKTRITLKLHMLTCGPCARYLKQIKYLKDAMQAHDERLGTEDPSQKLRDETKASIKERLRLQMAVDNHF